MNIEREYYRNGNIRFEKYFINNELHREDEPAFIHYYDNGQVKIKQYCIFTLYYYYTNNYVFCK